MSNTLAETSVDLNEFVERLPVTVLSSFSGVGKGLDFEDPLPA